MRPILLISTLHLLTGCELHRHTVDAPLPAQGKPMALVDVSAELGMQHASIDVTFEADMTDVAVSAWGVDGLVVTSPPITQIGSVHRSEHRVFQVDYAPASGESTLAVSVSVVRGGSRMQRVVSFAVGERPAPPPAVARPTGSTPGLKILPLPN